MSHNRLDPTQYPQPENPEESCIATATALINSARTDIARAVENKDAEQVSLIALDCTLQINSIFQRSGLQGDPEIKHQNSIIRKLRKKALKKIRASLAKKATQQQETSTPDFEEMAA